MPRKMRRAPENLPQQAETWHLLIQQLRIWITPPDEEPWRPYIVLVLNIESGVLQFFELVPERPAPEQLQDILWRAMQQPPKNVGQKPHRPARVQFEEAAPAQTLKPALEKLNIEVQVHPRFDEMNELIVDMEENMRGGPENPGLLSVKGVTTDLVGGVFAAAADFYRAEPWVQLTDQHPLAIRVLPEQQPRLAIVMGNAGMEYGLAVYRRWEDVERLYGFVDDPMEAIPPDGAHSLFFGRINEVPFADLEAIEQYGWEIADNQAYPIPIIYTPNDKARRPTKADLQWYEAALRAIPIFVRDYLKPDPQAGGRPYAYQPVEVEFTVPARAGEVEVHVKFPAGTISPESRPVDLFDWPDEDEAEDEMPQFDRRAMEGTLAMMGGSGFTDPDMQEAQELMYQAWDERNPARRIILAHEALEISPDCADAYVLLAEEEADTLARALEYYQQGVAAGERALGKKYFKENQGYFWGLLETRPYMRARQGLANILWELGRKEEALEHYQDLLRLNPGDNQGIRYSLLNLLLSLNRDADAEALIDQFEDDAMAEWCYSRALLTFRREGASPAAEELLAEAMETNEYVPAYLTGRKRIPNRRPAYITWGGEDEAIAYAGNYISLWRQTPGGVEWLRGHLKPPAPTRKAKSTRRRRGKSRSSRK